MTKSMLHLFILIPIILASSSSNDKKLMNKIKHAKPNYKHACSDFEKDFRPTVEKRLLVPVNENKNFASLQSMNQIYDLFLSQCSENPALSRFENNLVEITWRYQFFESPHCIRVELDLGNLTKFKNSLNFGYYMFSYREFGKGNHHLKKQIIDASINTLILHRVYIKPYIVCVTFYKNNPKFYEANSSVIISNKNETTRTTPLNCTDFNDLFLNDDRVHDADLCVDIDTQAHFLSAINSDTENSGRTDVERELIMVVFIICLLVFILSLITIAHYIIEKPKKRRILQAWYQYIKNPSQHHSNNNRANHFRSKTPSFSPSSVGSHGSINKDKVNLKDTGGPIITITDYSHNNTSFSQLTDKSEDSKESDPLMPVNNHIALVASVFTPAFTPAFVPVLTNDHSHKVMFHIGETIVEESPSSSQFKLVEETNDSAGNEDNQECIKSISHLLNDKPWSSSQAQFDTRRQSRSNSFFNNNNQTLDSNE